MNLAHLLTGSYDYKLVLGVIYQKLEVREHPSTDISNTVLDILIYPETPVSAPEKKGRF